MFNKNPKNELQLTYLKRLHHLLDNGYSLIEALKIMKWDRMMRPIAQKMIQQLKQGKQLHDVFACTNFHHSIVSFLYFVHLNGNILASMEKAIEMTEYRLTYVNRFIQTIRYPIFLLFIFTILLFFMKRHILPSFLELFIHDTDAASTIHLSITIIDISISIVLFCIVLFLIALLLWHFYKRDLFMEKQIKFYSKLPIVKSILSMQTSFYFATHMSMLLTTGISMKHVLTILSKQKQLYIVSYYAQKMKSHVSKGQPLQTLFPQLFLLEKELGKIFHQNNNHYSLQKDLTIYANLLAENIQRKMMRMITIIQPIFFIVLASFIIFIYISLMWPMFDMIQTI